MADMNGGGGAPFVGDVTAPISDGFGSSGRSEGGLLPQGGSIIPAGGITDFADPLAGVGSGTTSGGGFNLGGIISGVGNILGQIPAAVSQYITPQNVAIAGGTVAAVLAARYGARYLPKFLVNTAIGNSVTALYTGLRQRGLSHKRAHRIALQAHGIMLRRRRMRATNVVALRRAIRRVRGARRILGKVRALHAGGRGGSYRPSMRRRYRRGDLNPFMVEDRLEQMDEWEDAGGEDRPFSGEEAAE